MRAPVSIATDSVAGLIEIERLRRIRARPRSPALSSWAGSASVTSEWVASLRCTWFWSPRCSTQWTRARGPGRPPRRCGCARCARPRFAPRRRAIGLQQLRRNEVDRRRAEPARDIGAVRPLIDLARRAELNQNALAHDADAVGHRHRLDLVVRDVEHGGAQLALDALELEPQFGAQLGVERRQRLVHQIDRRLAHQRAADRDALHLAAGQARSRGCRASARCAAAPPPPGPGGGSSPRPCAAPASAAERPDCRRPSDADRANIAGTRRRRRARPARPCVTSRPPITTLPRSGRSSPAISRSVVVLPAPVGPSSTTNSPSRDARAKGHGPPDRAEALGDVVERDLSHGAPPA